MRPPHQLTQREEPPSFTANFPAMSEPSGPPAAKSSATLGYTRPDTTNGSFSKPPHLVHIVGPKEKTHSSPGKRLSWSSKKYVSSTSPCNSRFYYSSSPSRTVAAPRNTIRLSSSGPSTSRGSHLSVEIGPPTSLVLSTTRGLDSLLGYLKSIRALNSVV